MLEFRYDTQLLIEGENLDEDTINEYFTNNFKGDCLLAVGDEGFQRKSKERMKELMTMGTTVLFVSHSLPQIEEMCDKVIWIEEHKIKEIGKTKEICEKYQQYWIKEE